MYDDHDSKEAIIVASERLTNYRTDWQEVPVNHALLVDKNVKITLQPIEIS